MPAPASNDELFALIAKSGVLDDARLNAYLDRLRAANSLPADPIKLGEKMVADGQLTHFQAEQLLQGRWKRFSIGKYKVLERLGVGGMGQVFLCEHKLMKRKVAVKVLPAAKSKDEAALQRFYREARAVAAVDHPNIVRAYDIDDDNDLHFLVMEFVDGVNLYDLVRKSGPMPPLRACHYIYGTAVGLQHAHEMGLIHRDIKPANILVDRVGTVKILDMGLARFFTPDDDDHLTKKFDENVLGTADYLAPEQAVDSTTVDIRADIYGLGGTFYFMLTGQPPFPDGTIAQKLMWHQSKPPKPISDYRPDVPPQLAAVVEKMLAKEPLDRYQTPTEVMAALVGWVQTPIPPPAEDELPKLSVAAGGRAPGSSPTMAASAAVPPPAMRDVPPAPPTPRPKPSQLPVAPPPPPPTAPNRPAVAAPKPPAAPVVVAKPLPPPAPKPAVAVATPPAVPAPDSANVWSDLRSGETIPTAQDTTRSPRRKDRDRDDVKPSRSGRRSTRDEDEDEDDNDDRRPTRRKKKGSPLLGILLAAGGLLLVGGGVTAAVLLFGKPAVASAPSTDPKASGEKRVWYVSKSGDSPNPAMTKKTFGDFHRGDVRSGDDILLLDDSVEMPQLVLQAVKDIRIAAANPAKSVKVVYKPPTAGKPPLAVFLLDGTENVTLSGLVIDAGGLHDVGVQVSGSARGVRLENVTVRGAKKHGVLVRNVAADGNPLTLTGCRFVLPAGAESGVNISASKDVDTRGVKIENCRFEGVGAGAGVRIEGATADVEVRNNRMFNFDVGVLYVTVPDPVAKMSVTVERNTVHTAKGGVRIDQAAAERAVSVKGNYFAAAGVAVAAADPKGVTSSGNGRDAATQPGLGADVAEGAIPTPPADAPDDKFLRGKVTLGGKTVGAE